MDDFINAFIESLNLMVHYASIGMVTIIGIGLVIFGVKWIVGVLKSFFVKLSGEYEDTYEYYASGRRDSDYDYDINS